MVLHSADVSGDDDWWLRSGGANRFINRRWRKQKPGDLHPRRRSSDKEAHPGEGTAPADPFDPETLFQPGPSGPAPDGIATPDAVEPWATLGLGSDATWDEIATRHRELAKQHHPDLIGAEHAAGPDGAERMATINAAFAELGRIYRITGDR